MKYKSVKNVKVDSDAVDSVSVLPTNLCAVWVSVVSPPFPV